MPTTGMVLWQNIQSGATAKASVVQVGAAGSKGGAGRDEFRSDHFARCQQRNARRPSRSPCTGQHPARSSGRPIMRSSPTGAVRRIPAYVANRACRTGG